MNQITLWLTDCIKAKQALDILEKLILLTVIPLADSTVITQL